MEAVRVEVIGEEMREQQARYDLQTQFSELVDGNMRTSFELIFDGHDLYGEDGRSLTEITQKSLEEAKEIAKADPSLWFEIRRRGLEDDEIRLIIDMAKGEGPNTMVIASDFPPELMDATEDVGGYNIRRKQTMLRVITRDSQGKIKMVSQSIDGSDRQALEAIYTHLGSKAEPGELLGQRIQKDMPSERQETLADELVGVHDRSLSTQLGGEWYAGRRPADYRNTFEFVCRQHDLIEEGVRLKNLGWLNQTVMYNMAATMNRRFKDEQRGIVSPAPRSVTADQAALYHEMELNGNQAREAGESFSACGETLTGGKSSTEQKLKDAGYGNQSMQPETGGACVYVHDGCYCCSFNDDGTLRATKMKVRARRDASGEAHCLRKNCNAWLSADGKYGDIGDIAKKAQALKARSRTDFVLTND